MISRSNDKWLESVERTRSCYEKDIDLCSSYKVSGDIYTLLGFRQCWVTQPVAVLTHTHTHTKKADLTFFFIFILFRCLLSFLLLTSWWNAHHTSEVIEFEQSTIYNYISAPFFDALILLATCWDLLERVFYVSLVSTRIRGVSCSTAHGADWTIFGRRFTWKWWIASMWFVTKNS
jgi:hypothetical protein